MNNFRPLRSIGQFLSTWARGKSVQTTVRYSGRIRTAVDYIGVALGWMSRGYQYDTRTFMQRMGSGRYFWLMALAVLTFRDLGKAHDRYSRKPA